MELEINKKLIRKGISKEVYFVKDKSLLIIFCTIL